MKLVSVVVATYRREAELEKALASLAGQRYSEFEIILVDDNGDAEWNKRVADTVSRFKADNPNFALKVIVNSPNQGSAMTRNTGISAAEGEYVTFLDDDDIYLPSKIEAQLGFMVEGGYDYSITDLSLCNGDGREIEHRTREYIKDTSCGSLLKYHLIYHMTGTDTMMFKKTYLDKIGGFAPIDVGDEFYLMQRAIEGGGSFGYLPRCDVMALVHTGEGGLSSGEGKIQGENALHEYKKTFFHRLDRKSIRYIRMRHQAVIAFAHLRRGRYVKCLLHGACSFLHAPLSCVRLVLNRKI